jgi:hypothetical protein
LIINGTQIQIGQTFANAYTVSMSADGTQFAVRDNLLNIKAYTFNMIQGIWIQSGTTWAGTFAATASSTNGSVYTSITANVLTIYTNDMNAGFLLQVPKLAYALNPNWMYVFP